MALSTKGEQKLDALHKSAFASPTNSSYHGKDIKIVVNLDRAIKQNFFYYILINGSWIEIDKDMMVMILNN